MFDKQHVGISVFGSSNIDNDVIDTLSMLFLLTDWRCVLIDNMIEVEYNNIPVISIFKAITLPYLINIPGERTIVKALNSNLSLQILCGFLPSNLPQERTFWHFRHKYKNIFSDLMLRILINMVLSGQKPNYDLPFVNSIEVSEDISDENLIDITYDHYRPRIYIQQENLLSNLSSQSPYESKEYQEWQMDWREKLKYCNDFDHYYLLYKQYRKDLMKFRRLHAKGFLKELRFPIEVVTSFLKNKISFQLVEPPWFEVSKPATFPDIKSSTPYTKACNVIVQRQNGEKVEILLSQRKETGYGQGEYAIPGGKQKPGETLEECAKREVKEETGIVILRSHPVSLYKNLNPKDPNREVLSVGIIADEWEGEVKTLEQDRHTVWGWHDIDTLPEPLFEPTQIALNHYIDNIYPNLSWSDVEKKPTTQLRFF